MTDHQSFNDLINELDQLRPDPEYLDDELALYCCRLALDALEQGSYGIAAVLTDPQGNVVAQAENQVFSGGQEAIYNSRGHAEMLLIDQLESGAIDCPPAQLTLLVSLEPCPMCLSRLLLSGIGSVRYIASDPDGGMLKHLHQLPPVWCDLAQLQNHYHAHVSPAVEKFAGSLATMNLAQLRHKLFMHIRP